MLTRPLNLLSNGNELTEADLVQLTKMNAKFTHVLFGSKNKIAFITKCELHGTDYTYLSLEEFATYLSDEPHISKRNAGRAWSQWSGKNRKTDGIGFYPDVSRAPATHFNTYIPSPIKPKEGDCSAYLNHILEVICANDSKVFEYVMQYFAHIIQRPQEKPSVAIVLKSVEGTGKGTMMRPLLEIVGSHGIQINGDRHITGQFNGAVANKLLVFADEVNLTSSKEADKVKAFISENTVLLEKKGLEAVAIPNYARLVLASNNSQVISAGLLERRYLVLEPSSHKAQDKTYFAPLYCWINEGGASKLMHHLQQLDIRDFDPFKAPVTEGLIDQKLQSFPPHFQFLKEHLTEPSLFLIGAQAQQTGTINISDFIKKYINWCLPQKINIKRSTAYSDVGKLMTALSGPPEGRSNRGNGKTYNVTNIALMRTRFAEHVGLEPQDIFD
jgi:putative DNA primase/helicase